MFLEVRVDPGRSRGAQCQGDGNTSRHRRGRAQVTPDQPRAADLRAGQVRDVLMATSKPIDIPWPLSSAPGASPQEAAGRLVNCYAEPLGEAQAGSGGRAGKGPVVVWRGCPGFSPIALMAQSGYRGGLIVNNLSYECYLNNASTLDASATVVSLGNFPGS